ncbi:MAG TPA: hypothetical protein VK357_05080 [Rubrobacteraceae bacterium]|nr:hypothetical protein [Rubrobacteraceae bacterium]
MSGDIDTSETVTPNSRVRVMIFVPIEETERSVGTGDRFARGQGDIERAKRRELIGSAG